MSAEDRVRWDKIYRQRARDPYPSPNPLLLQFTPAVTEGDTCRALDLAGGMGQNALWLAAQGYTVDLMDISRVGLQRARTEMTIHNLRTVNLLQIDVDGIQLEVNIYDLITVTHYLKRDLFPTIIKATKSGGRIIYDTFNIRYLELVPEFNRAFLLAIGELQSYFSQWDILHYEEDDHNSRIIAVKPR